jgi:hypothetical protein
MAQERARLVSEWVRGAAMACLTSARICVAAAIYGSPLRARDRG